MKTYDEIKSMIDSGKNAIAEGLSQALFETIFAVLAELNDKVKNIEDRLG